MMHIAREQRGAEAVRGERAAGQPLRNLPVSAQGNLLLPPAIYQRYEGTLTKG
jgi:hypothetical protein